MLKTSGVYQISSTIKPERVYIGSSKDITNRWSGHMSEMRKDKHHSIKLQRHVNKYGLEDLSFSILESCPPELLIQREQHYIDTLNPYFNEIKVAYSRLGYKATPEARKNMSEAGKRRAPMSEESKKKNSEAHLGQIAWNKGKPMLEQTRVALLKVITGRVKSEEERKKLHDANIGKVMSAESRKKMSIAKKGKPISEKTRKNRPSQKGRIITPEWRKKISISHMGMHHSEESKQKMRVTKALIKAQKNGDIS